MSDKHSNNSLPKVCEPAATYSIRSARSTRQHIQPDTTNDIYAMDNTEINRALASLENHKKNPELAMDYADFKKWLKELTA